jgi:hypothetical protein
MEMVEEGLQTPLHGDEDMVVKITSGADKVVRVVGTTHFAEEDGKAAASTRPLEMCDIAEGNIAMCVVALSVSLTQCIAHHFDFAFI